MCIRDRYNANLYDLVKLYDNLGDDLFKDNVREKIENVLDVDTEIKNTLEKHPESFWFLNNGITLLVESDNIKQRREYQLDIKVNNNCDVSVINGAQTISVAAMYYLNLIEKLQDMELSDQDKEKYRQQIGRERLIFFSDRLFDHPVLYVGDGHFHQSDKSARRLVRVLFIPMGGPENDEKQEAATEEQSANILGQ